MGEDQWVGVGWNNRAVYKPAVRRSVFRLCIKMTDNRHSHTGRLESSRYGDNDASLGSHRAGLHVILAANINPFTFHVTRNIRTCVELPPCHQTRLHLTVVCKCTNILRHFEMNRRWKYQDVYINELIKVLYVFNPPNKEIKSV